MLQLVRLKEETLIHHLKRKDRIGHVEYWKAAYGETRPSGLERGKGCKALPIVTSSLCLFLMICSDELRNSTQELNPDSFQRKVY